MKVLVLTEGSASSRYWEGSLPLLKEREVDLIFVTVRPRGEVHSRLEALDIETHTLDARLAVSYPLAAYRLAQLSKNRGIAVIHACESIPAFIAGLSCLLPNPAKVIFNRQHNVVSGKQRILSFVGSQMADLIMPVSKSSGESAVEFDKVDPKKIRIAYSGIEPMRPVSCTEVQELRRSLRIPEEARVISVVARLREEKGFRTLFEALTILSKKLSHPLCLIVAGDGDDGPAIKKAAALTEGFTAYFVGNQSDVALWFSAGDLVAMPSYHEAFGLAAVEAMSCGKPLVASNVGGLAEIIENGVNGLLVPPKDPAALANGMLEVLDSPDTASMLGTNASRRASYKFSIEAMVDGWIGCYNFVLGQPR